GWQSTASVSPITGLTGQLSIGSSTVIKPTGSLQLVADLKPLQISLHWKHPGGAVDVIPIWPSPDAQGLARALAKAAPSLGAHAALEIMRGADESARPIIDAMLDALGLLRGV